MDALFDHKAGERVNPPVVLIAKIVSVLSKTPIFATNRERFSKDLTLKLLCSK